MVRRLRLALPRGWFGPEAPVLDAVLGGLADGWARLYALLGEVRRQGRIASASGGMLDLMARDYFGDWLRRRVGQGDEALRAAIGRELLRERATRGGLAAALTDLTGRAPVIFEPARPADTGGWGVALGYGAAGGYGSLALPFQCFVTAFRPLGAGIGGVVGYEGLRGDGLLDSRVVSSRTSDGTYFDADGVLRVAGPGVARVDFSAGAPALLVEGASANQLLNPRAEGAVVGSPGTAPTGWFIAATNGLTSSVVGVGTEGGIPYIDIRWQGTTSNTSSPFVRFSLTTGNPAALGQAWTASVFLRLVAGGFGAPADGPFLQLVESGGSGSTVVSQKFYPTITSAALRGGRFAAARTLTGAATANCYALVGTTYPAGAVVDFTLRVGAPQLEQQPIASSVMLPPVGAPGVASRSAESVGIPATLPGGYGAGAIEYASPAMVLGQVTDADIHAAAAASLPAAAIAWLRISS